MHRFLIFVASLALTAGAYAQATDQATNAKQLTLPAGTTVLLHLRSPINTKSARVGDSARVNEFETLPA